MDCLVNNFKTFALEDIDGSNLNLTWKDMENTYSLVLEVLTKATSQKANDIKPAEQQLKIWEALPGFYNVLLTVYLDQNVPTTVRWLAVMMCKNGIERYWRLSAPNSLSPEERDNFRSRVLTNLGEPNYQLAVQHAVLVAKVARYDYPKEWPYLIPTLTQMAQDPNTGGTHALLILHHVTKALCSKRLAGDRQGFLQLVRNIFGIILNIWTTNAKAFFAHSSSSMLPEALAALEKARLSLKVLRKLLIYGYKDPHLSEEPVQLVNYLFEQMKPMLECRKMIQSEYEHLKKLTEKNLILILKILHELLEFHSFSFIQFITPTLQICTSVCFTPEGEAFQFRRFTIMALNLVKAILLCAEYSKIPIHPQNLGQKRFIIRRGYAAKEKERIKNPEVVKANEIIKGFFTESMQCQIFNSLISNYFLLTPEDFLQWEEDPETYATEQSGESWKFSLRPCAESLFLTVFRESRDLFRPLIVQQLQMIQMRPNNACTLQQMLLKEAVYTAVGLASFELFDEIDFDSWFTSTLIKELQEKDPNLKFLKRRVIWLVGMWIGVRFNPANRGMLYGVLLNLMDFQEDRVVQLTAVNTLKLALDDFEFSLDTFLPYLEQFVSRIHWLLVNLTESDSKLIVLNCLNMLLSRVGSEIQPHAQPLINYFPTLWESCGDNSMLHCSLLAILVRLVESLSEISDQLHSLVVPLIAMATDPNQPSCVYLLDDGLDLWRVALCYAKHPSQPLLNLNSNLFLLLESNPEHFSTYTKIFLTSSLFMPTEFQKMYAAKMAEALFNMMSDLKADEIECLVTLVKHLQLIYQEESFSLLRPILTKLAGSLLECQQNRTHLPVFLQSASLVVLSQVVLQNRDHFVALVQDTGSKYHQLPDQVLEKLLRLMLDTLPISYPMAAQKSMALCLVALLTLPSPVISYLINGIMIAIVEVLNDICVFDDQRSHLDMLVLTPEDLVETEFESEHECRMHKLGFKDPNSWVVLKDALNSQLQALDTQGQLGEMMSGLDTETSSQLCAYLHPSLLH